MAHDLKITSLRDLQAECSCGQWSLTSPASDDLTDAGLRRKAEREHRKHLHRHDADPDTTVIAARDIREGDFVDLEDDPFLSDEVSAEFEMAEVTSVEHETPNCVVIGYDCNRAAGYDPAQLITIRRRSDS